MQKFRVLVIYALLIVAAVYAGIKAYIYFSIKGELDTVIAHVGPFAEISYRGISSDIRGKLSVEGFEMSLPDQPLPLRIDAMRLEGPGIGFLFDVAAGFEDNRVPRWMYITLNRVELPDVRDLAIPGLPVETGALNWDIEPCSLAGLLRHAAPLRSDSYPMMLTLRMGYRFDRSSSTGMVELGYDMPGGESMSVEFEVSDMPQPGAVVLGVVPTLETLNFSYVPAAANLKRELSECAGNSGLSVAMYAEKLLSQPADILVKELGFVPGNGLRQAIERFLLAPGEIKIAAGPIDDVLQTASAQYPPQQLIKLLDLELNVNGQTVSDLSFQTAAPVEYASSDETTGQASGAKPDERIRARFIETPTNELKNYLGRDVRMLVAGHDDTQRGVLISVRDKEANVEKRLLRGKMTLHVPLEDIVQIEVMRFPDRVE
jgi:hypothetical protein